MNASKSIGIFMDYASAHIMEFSEKPNEIKTIESNFIANLRKERNKGEKYLCSLAKKCQTDYFKKIADTILNYDKVLLFGPTNAKAELFNMLREDPHFFKIKTYMEETIEMTPMQRNKFIHKHFTGLSYESA
jgi:stalled ribosome rescue protein Dom34